MSFDTSWDVEKYKTEFESDDHWKLRRDFMVTHKNKFPEQRLICLAQVFFNVEFLGCRYPEQTMKLIEELSKDVAAEHREQQKTKLQRTFVCASDAAGAKVKGVKHTNENASNVETSPEKKQKTVNLENSNSVFFKDPIGNRFEMSSVHSSNMNWNTSASNYTGQSNSITSRACNKFDVQSKNITMEEIRRTTRPFGNVVIFWKVGESPAYAVERTARQWGKKYECTVKGDCKGLWVGSINFENVELAKYVGSDKITVRKKVGEIALNKLRRSYFTVKIKCNFCGGDEVVKTTGIEKINDPSATDQNSSNPDTMESSDVNVPIQDDNIGNKLLKMMGWSGGGLGKNQQGIIEPIKANDAQNKRAGFGSAARDVDNEAVNINQIKKIIQDYRHSSDLNDLVFSPEFSKEQRSIYHKYAIKLGLKTKSYGGKKEENRHLVISKKIDNWTIIDGLVKNVDQFFNKYELIRPGENIGDDDDGD